MERDIERRSKKNRVFRSIVGTKEGEKIILLNENAQIWKATILVSSLGSIFHCSASFCTSCSCLDETWKLVESSRRRIDIAWSIHGFSWKDFLCWCHLPVSLNNKEGNDAVTWLLYTCPMATIVINNSWFFQISPFVLISFRWIS